MRAVELARREADALDRAPPAGHDELLTQLRRQAACWWRIPAPGPHDRQRLALLALREGDQGERAVLERHHGVVALAHPDQ